MSAQFTTSIPFSFSHTLGPVRLVELPPALLSLLSSGSPPTLTIKASSTVPTSVHSTENHAVLCTPTQTFSLRQVYSSNSLILLQPSAPANPPPLDDDDDDPLTLLPPRAGVKAVSTVSSYLELIPTIHPATPLLLAHTPVFPTPSPPTTTTPITKSTLLSTLPLSPAEFDAAWAAAHCFTCPSGFAHRPTPSTLLSTLTEIFTCAAAASLPLTSPFTLPALLATLDPDPDSVDHELHPGLVAAAVAAVAVEEGGDCWRLEEQKCVCWVGKTVLQEWGRGEGRGDMLCVSFLRRWEMGVPVEWRAGCRLDGIKGWYTHPTPNTVRFAECVEEAPAAAKPVGRNKWHEKFGKGKRR